MENVRQCKLQDKYKGKHKEKHRVQRKDKDKDKDKHKYEEKYKVKYRSPVTGQTERQRLLHLDPFPSGSLCCKTKVDPVPSVVYHQDKNPG